MTEPSPLPVPAPRPEPVVDAARWVSYVVSVTGVLATAFGAYGAITDQKWALGIAAALAAVTTGLAKVLPVQAAKAARAQVTPLASPQSVDGSPLVPVQKVSGADVSTLMGPDAA